MLHAACARVSVFAQLASCKALASSCVRVVEEFVELVTLLLKLRPQQTLCATGASGRRETQRGVHDRAPPWHLSCTTARTRETEQRTTERFGTPSKPPPTRT